MLLSDKFKSYKLINPYKPSTFYNRLWLRFNSYKLTRLLNPSILYLILWLFTYILNDLRFKVIIYLKSFELVIYFISCSVILDLACILQKYFWNKIYSINFFITRSFYGLQIILLKCNRLFPILIYQLHVMRIIKYLDKISIIGLFFCINTIYLHSIRNICA